MQVTALMVSGLDIVGFKVENNGEVKSVKYADFIKLVETGRVQGVSLIDGSLIGLKFSELKIESGTKLTILEKQYENDKVTGYTVIRDGENIHRSISIQKAWDIAALGGITNASAYMYANSEMEVVKSLIVDTEKP